MSFSEDVLVAVERKMNRADSLDEYTNLPEFAWYIDIDDLYRLWEEKTPNELKEYFLED